MMDSHKLYGAVIVFFLVCAGVYSCGSGVPVSGLVTFVLALVFVIGIFLRPIFSGSEGRAADGSERPRSLVTGAFIAGLDNGMAAGTASSTPVVSRTYKSPSPTRTPTCFTPTHTPSPSYPVITGTPTQAFTVTGTPTMTTPPMCFIPPPDPTDTPTFMLTCFTPTTTPGSVPVTGAGTNFFILAFMIVLFQQYAQARGRCISEEEADTGISGILYAPHVYVVSACYEPGSSEGEMTESGLSIMLYCPGVEHIPDCEDVAVRLNNDLIDESVFQHRDSDAAQPRKPFAVIQIPVTPEKMGEEMLLELVLISRAGDETVMISRKTDARSLIETVDGSLVRHYRNNVFNDELMERLLRYRYGE